MKLSRSCTNITKRQSLSFKMLGNTEEWHETHNSAFYWTENKHYVYLGWLANLLAVTLKTNTALQHIFIYIPADEATPNYLITSIDFHLQSSYYRIENLMKIFYITVAWWPNVCTTTNQTRQTVKNELAPNFDVWYSIDNLYLLLFFDI